MTVTVTSSTDAVSGTTSRPVLRGAPTLSPCRYEIVPTPVDDVAIIAHWRDIVI